MSKSVKEYLSVPVNAKTLMLHQLKRGDALLFLYAQGVDKYPVYSSFIKTGLENNELCFYAYDTKDHKWHPELVFKKYIDGEQLHLLPLEQRNPIPKLESRLKLLYNRARAKNNTLRALIDFGAIGAHNPANIISCERKIIKNSKIFRFIGITALELASLSYDEITELLSIHEKTAIFTPYDVGIMTLSTSAKRKLKEAPIELISMEPLEQFIKNNLENIVLFLLQEQSLCGYDIIKTVSQRYHVFLSQGTVYPLLYSLTQQGLLAVRQEIKEKIYSPTEEGSKIIQSRLDEFRKAHEYMLSLLGKGGK